MRRITTVVVSVALCLVAVPALAGWEEGVAAFKAGNYAQAANEFRELAEQQPGNWQLHYMLGLSFERLGQRDEALQPLRKAHDLNPGDVTVKISLGRAYSGARRHGDAAEVLSSVDAGSLPATQQPGFYQLRGLARMRADDLAGAVTDLEQLAGLKPSDAKVQFMYGTAALNAGLSDQGLRALAEATRLAPRDADMKRAYAQALIGKARTTRDKASKTAAFAAAATVAGELVAADPTYDNLIMKVSAELGAGSYEAAIATGKAAAAKRDSDWLAHYYLGQAYTSAGQYQEAEASLTTAATKTTSPADLKLISRQLGFAYEKQAKYALAIEAYQRAGDQGAVARVREKEATAAQNAEIDAENQRIEQMRREAAALEEELKALESGGGGGR